MTEERLELPDPKERLYRPQRYQLRVTLPEREDSESNRDSRGHNPIGYHYIIDPLDTIHAL